MSAKNPRHLATQVLGWAAIGMGILVGLFDISSWALPWSVSSMLLGFALTGAMSMAAGTRSRKKESA